MADEAIEYVELMAKGCYYLLKGSAKVIEHKAKAIKAISNFTYEKYQNRKGNVDWSTIKRNSQGDPGIVELPEEVMKINPETGTSVFDDFVKKNNLQYSMMPDFDIADDYMPVAFASQDLILVQEFVKTHMESRAKSEELEIKSYDEKIDGATQRLSLATDPSEKKSIETEIENLQVAKSQNETLLSETKEKMDMNNTMSFMDYLKASKDTEFDKNPKVALEKLNKGIELSKTYTPLECMYPIREPALFPESGLILYTQPNSDATIKRTFGIDEKGIGYSTYTIFKGEEELTSINDKAITNAEFNVERAELLNNASMVENLPCRTDFNLSNYSTNERWDTKSFLSETSEHIKTKELSSEDAKSLVDKNKDEKIFNEVENVSSFTVKVDDFIMKSAKPEMALTEGNVVISPSDMSKESGNNIKVNIDKTKEYTLTKADGKKVNLSGKELVEKMNDKFKEKAENLAKNISQGIRK